MEYDWPDADALVLVAAGFGERSLRYDDAQLPERRLSVGDVLGTVDYIERVVLDAQELDGAIRRLGAAGFLEADGDEVMLGRSGRALLRENDGATVFDQLALVRARLSEHARPDAQEGHGLAVDAAVRAVDEYLDRD